MPPYSNPFPKLACSAESTPPPPPRHEISSAPQDALEHFFHRPWRYPEVAKAGTTARNDGIDLQPRPRSIAAHEDPQQWVGLPDHRHSRRNSDAWRRREPKAPCREGGARSGVLETRSRTRSQPAPGARSPFVEAGVARQSTCSSVHLHAGGANCHLRHRPPTHEAVMARDCGVVCTVLTRSERLLGCTKPAAGPPEYGLNPIAS